MSRICLLNNHLYLRGGAERVLFEEAELLRQNGHEVLFFGCRGPADLVTEHARYYPPTVPIDGLRGLEKWSHSPKVVYNRAHGRAFRRFLGETKPQLIHAHNIYGALTSAVLDTAKDAGIPVLLTVHDYKLVCPSYLALDHGRVCKACTGGRFHHCLLKRCHKSNLAASAVYTAEAYLTKLGRKYDVVRHLLSPSRYMRQTLLENGYSPERVLHVPNFVDSSRIQPTPGEGTPALYVGRLSPEKGIPTLLKAIRGLERPLHIVGGGPLRNALEQEAREQGLQDLVRFKGHLSGDALADEYRRAAFVVVPSEWYENAPMVVLEAFAHGKAVVGADIGGIPELVAPDRTGLLFPPGDAEALREAMLRLWKDPESRRAMGQAARGRVEHEFSPETHLQTLERIYEDCLCRG
jgi:glycosyltransferase involved in cell wall biosynthesis